jgi:hypothetical protein
MGETNPIRAILSPFGDPFEGCLSLQLDEPMKYANFVRSR